MVSPDFTLKPQKFGDKQIGIMSSILPKHSVANKIVYHLPRRI